MTTLCAILAAGLIKLVGLTESVGRMSSCMSMSLLQGQDTQVNAGHCSVGLPNSIPSES